ncbi:hypothetical protein [Rhodococcus pyridinivorans]
MSRRFKVLAGAAAAAGTVALMAPATASAAVDATATATIEANSVTWNVQNGDEQNTCTARAKENGADKAYASRTVVSAGESLRLTLPLPVAGVYQVSWECYGANTYSTETIEVTIPATQGPSVLVGSSVISLPSGSAIPGEAEPSAALTQEGTEAIWKVRAGSTEVNCRSRVFDGPEVARTQAYVVPPRVEIELRSDLEPGDYTTTWVCFTDTESWGNEAAPVAITVPA